MLPKPHTNFPPRKRAAHHLRWKNFLPIGKDHRHTILQVPQEWAIGDSHRSAFLDVQPALPRIPPQEEPNRGMTITTAA